jgi:hypothetical protein
MTYPDHKFNFITDISCTPSYVSYTQYNSSNTLSGNELNITTKFPHNLTTGASFIISNSGIDILKNHGPFTVYGYDNSKHLKTYAEINHISADVIVPSGVHNEFGFYYYNTNGQKKNTISGALLQISNQFKLYNCPSIDSIDSTKLNNIPFEVYDIIDENTFYFHVYNSYASTTKTFGSDIYISSFNDGIKGIQTNTKNDIVQRHINLEGANYAFLCCPQLATVINTKNSPNIFAKIILDQSPGAMVFNFLSNPKTFENIPLESLNKLSLSVLNYDGSKYIFNDLDYSFTLEITEIIDTTDNFNISSKRGTNDVLPINNVTII